MASRRRDGDGMSGMPGWSTIAILYLAVGATIGIVALATIPSGAPPPRTAVDRLRPLLAVLSAALLWGPAIVMVGLMAAAKFIAHIGRRSR
jgi:hypothetical protein